MDGQVATEAGVLEEAGLVAHERVNFTTRSLAKGPILQGLVRISETTETEVEGMIWGVTEDETTI